MSTELARCFLCHGNETPLEPTGCLCKNMYIHEACMQDVYELDEICAICKKQFTNKLFSKELSLDETFETLFAKFGKLISQDRPIQITFAELTNFIKRDHEYTVTDLYKTILRNNSEFIKYIPVDHQDYKEFIKMSLTNSIYNYTFIKNKIDKQMKKYILSIDPTIFRWFNDDERYDHEFCECVASKGVLWVLHKETITCDILKLAFANGFKNSIDVPEESINNADNELKNIISVNYDIDRSVTGLFQTGGIVYLMLKPISKCDINSKYYIKTESRPEDFILDLRVAESHAYHMPQNRIRVTNYPVSTALQMNHPPQNHQQIASLMNYQPQNHQQIASLMNYQSQNRQQIASLMNYRPQNHQQFAYPTMPYNPGFYY